MISYNGRIGGINTSGVEARNNADRLQQQYLHSLGQFAMDPDEVAPVFLGSRKLATATYVVGLARLASEYPSIIEQPVGLPVGPQDIGAEASREARLLQSGTHRAVSSSI